MKRTSGKQRDDLIWSSEDKKDASV